MMQSPTENDLVAPLAMTLVLTALAGAAAMAARMNPELAALFGRAFLVLSSYASFVWYCRDSDLHRYRRSLWRNTCFIFFALLFVPCYLVRTRPNGKRLFALAKLAGFAALWLGAILIGAVLGLVVLAAA
jgi:hypothetical protein